MGVLESLEVYSLRVYNLGVYRLQPTAFDIEDHSLDWGSTVWAPMSNMSKVVQTSSTSSGPDLGEPVERRLVRRTGSKQA